MNFSSQGKQLCIDDFKSSLEGLNKSNHWVQLGDTLPWDEIEKVYNQRLNNGKRGAGNKSARMIVEALVIKHKMNLSDVDIPNPRLGNAVITGIVQMLQHQATHRQADGDTRCPFLNTTGQTLPQSTANLFCPQAKQARPCSQ